MKEQMRDRFEKPPPEEWTRAIEAGFYAHLRAFLPTLDLPENIEASLRERLALRRTECEHLVQNELDRQNVQFTLLAVALFDVVEGVLARERAARLVDDCLNQPLRDEVIRGTRAMLDEAEDAFRALVDVSKHRERDYFGPSFEFERLIDDEHGYVLQIRRCLFHEVLLACGRSELQPLLCRFDMNWSDAIDAQRHHMSFVRPCTFATSTRCQMWFMRTEGDVASRLPVLRGP